MAIEKDVENSDHYSHHRSVSETVYRVMDGIPYPVQATLTILAEGQADGGLCHDGLVLGEGNVAWAHRALETDHDLSMTGYAHVCLHVG